MTAQYDVVTMGEAMALFLTQEAAPLRAADRFVRSVAGAESNVAVGVTRLGLRASWCGRVGDDALGLGVLDRLRGEGVDLSRAVIDAHASTGVLVRDRHAERTVNVSYARTGSAGSRLEPDDVDPMWIAAARFLHLSGITPALGRAPAEAVAYAASVAVEHGTRVSLDFNLRRRLWSDAQAAAALSPLLSSVDTLFAGEDELLVVSAQGTVRDGVRWALDSGVTSVVVKSGSAGATAYSTASSMHAASPRVTVVDAVGAGDAFVAGYLAAVVAGADQAASLAQACRMGAAAVQIPGDLEGLLYGSGGLLPPAFTGDVDR
jgi:2-dehydro-3-deoxygluconokinase